jgi:hypothetical protein
MMFVNLLLCSGEHSRQINTLFGKTSLFITFKHVVDTIITLLKGLIPFVFKKGSAGERGRGGSRGPGVWKGVRGPTVLRKFLSFSLVSLFVDLQGIPFRPIQNHSAAESQSLRFSIKDFKPARSYWRRAGGS